MLCSLGSSRGLSGKAPALPAGYQRSSPAPRITSTFVSSMYWRAISLCWSRSSTWAAKPAGEASVTWLVVTRPTDLPAALACSTMLRTTRLSRSTDCAVVGPDAGSKGGGRRGRVGDEGLGVGGVGADHPLYGEPVHGEPVVSADGRKLDGVALGWPHTVAHHEDHVLGLAGRPAGSLLGLAAPGQHGRAHNGREHGGQHGRAHERRPPAITSPAKYTLQGQASSVRVSLHHVAQGSIDPKRLCYQDITSVLNLG